MGVVVSAIRDQIEKADDAKGKKAECKEALENMRQTAQDHLDAFNDRIRWGKPTPVVVTIFNISLETKTTTHI
jgi:hypothetical protein